MSFSENEILEHIQQESSRYDLDSEGRLKKNPPELIISTQKSNSLPENPTDRLVADALAKEGPLTEQQAILKTFQDSLNEFIKKVGNFAGSKNQLQRVLINLAISPLNKEELHHGYPEEKELFELGTSVNSSKFFLMLSGLADQGKIAFIEDSKSVTSSDLTEEEKTALAELQAAEQTNEGTING